MRKGIIILYLLSIATGASLANVNTVDDPLKNNSQAQDQEVQEPQQETDTTSVPEDTSDYEVEIHNSDLDGFSELPELEASDPVEIPETKTYYDNDEDTEETNPSIISFNFLYYLLQKFKFSNSLGY